MTRRSTQEVVRRVMPVIDQIATRTIDKARLLQYLSARAGIDWGALELLEERDEGEADFGGTSRVLLVRDVTSQEISKIRYPVCLPEELDQLVQNEYKRLASDQSLSVMAPELFLAFFQESHCSRCRWSESWADNDQIHRECFFAGRPVSFEPKPDLDSN